jgi:uridine phosphorylase
MKTNIHYELAGGVQPHIRCKKGDIGEFVLLPGDPGRIDLIAELLDDVNEVAYNREHKTITGYYQGLKVSATSTGMGCPSSAIAIEELIRIGAKVLVRAGSTAAFADFITPGDYIMATGAIPLEGTSPIYLDGDPFSHAPDFDVLHALYHSAEQNKKKAHPGLVLINDAFYGETDEFVQKWYSRNVLSVEMESSILFLLGTLRGVKTGAFHLAGGNLVKKVRPALLEDEMRKARYTQHKIILDAFLELKNQNKV